MGGETRLPITVIGYGGEVMQILGAYASIQAKRA